jgi:hypothetical protein
MPNLEVVRWRRYGKDRLYVNGSNKTVLDSTIGYTRVGQGTDLRLYRPKLATF